MWRGSKEGLHHGLNGKWFQKSGLVSRELVRKESRKTKKRKCAEMVKQDGGVEAFYLSHLVITLKEGFQGITTNQMKEGITTHKMEERGNILYISFI